MVFNSFHFGVFFLLFLPVYWALPFRAQQLWLLAASLYFYSVWDWRFVALLLATCTLDYFWAIAIGAHRGTPRAKLFLLLSVTGNLGALALFKYFNFFIENLDSMLSALSMPISVRFPHLVLPIGISFYTFQEIGYVIDVYRGDLAPRRKYLDVLLFVTFFPHLVAGPINRAESLLTQVEKPRRFSMTGLSEGLSLMGWGLFKKVFVADNLASIVVNPIFDPNMGYTGSFILLGVYGFAFQIYCDFSGYTDMARGMARAMGVDLIRNFDRPYFAINPRDFWRRWHISLSTWLHDYLYVPLGGNRTGHTGRNLMLTMLLGGLWHGASWTFVLWGAYQGALLMIHRALGPRLNTLLPKSDLLRLAQLVGMFHLTCFGWLIFRAESLAHLGSLLTRMFGEFFVYDADFVLLRQLVFYVAPLLLFELWQERRGTAHDVELHWATRALALGTCLLLVIVFGDPNGAEFIYFQF